MTDVAQNDPEELLEVFDSHGRPTGVARTRAAIHLAGNWHKAFHCWIVRRDRTEVVLQRRSLHKDTFAGCWDAAADGHWRFGESAVEAAREISEELGISVQFEDLEFRGVERVAKRFANGLTDREWHQVYVLSDERPLRDYGPAVDEVMGLAAFPIAGLIALVRGASDSLIATEAVQVEADGALHPVPVSLTRKLLVPYSVARLRRMLGRSSAGSIQLMHHG